MNAKNEEELFLDIEYISERKALLFSLIACTVALVWVFSAQIQDIKRFEGIIQSSAKLVEVDSNENVPSELIGVMKVPENSVGQLEEGQKVKVRLNSFPYRKYGHIEGRLVSVSNVPKLYSSKDIFEADQYEVTVQFYADEPSSKVPMEKLKIGMKFTGLVSVDTFSVYEKVFGIF